MPENNQLRAVLLAFLAGRSPAAYKSATIAERVRLSGLLDLAPGIDDVERELRVLALPRLGWVDLAVDQVSQEVVWFATEAGIRRWTLDGSMCVRA